jgi:regulator of RNase E activity RraB
LTTLLYHIIGRDQDRKAIIEAMETRGVCYHSSWGDYFSDDDESMSDDESVDHEETELAYEQDGYYELMGDQ